jgi:hypothetical protein
MVTVCPYTTKDDNENNQHAWCFPKKIPSIAISSISKSYRLPHSYPTVRFESSCKCGNGDNTGCKSGCLICAQGMFFRDVHEWSAESVALVDSLE